MKLVDIQVACDTQPLPKQQQIEQWFAKACLQAQASVNIVFVECEQSQQYNLQYRNKNKPTNVLSFPYECPDFIDPQETDFLLGDLIICPDVVAKEATEQQKSLFDHYAHMIIHGTLHLQGYDHIEEIDAQKMESLEIQLLAELNINDPYQLGPPHE